MENQVTINITSHEVQEAMEQIRMGFTASRIALGSATILYTLKRKGDKWAKKFTKIQQDYHKFLLDTYNELEAALPELESKENNNSEIEG